MDFFTAQDSPVTIRIDGETYDIPRFLLPMMEKWSAQIMKQAADQATAHLNKDDKARFLLYYPPPMVDVADIAQMVRTPAGVQHVLKACLTAGKVPADKITLLINNGDPKALRQLADILGSATSAVPTDSKEGKPSPLIGPADGSNDSPATGAETAPDSTPSTAASTQAA